MIDNDKPDFQLTPASDRRPDYHYMAAALPEVPLLSILMPYYNTGPIFADTVASLQRMTIPSWECVVVDDGSTDVDAVAQLDQLAASEQRIRVLRRPNAGRGAARNIAFASARARFLMHLDAGDLVEPTFAEKAIWFLETQPQFGACGAWMLGFGSKEYTWTRGFNEYERSLSENVVNPIALIRREAWEATRGYDVTATSGSEDWDFWLNMAGKGYWGYTLSEFLSWHRNHPRTDTSPHNGADSFDDLSLSQWIRSKHQGLEQSFPHPIRVPSIEQPHAPLSYEIPFQNQLAKPKGRKRVLCLFPWMEIGGADKFNLDMVQWLSAQDYQFTIVTTESSSNPWYARFSQLSPDIFCLESFLNRADYPRFLDYLIESRQVDAVLMSHSYFAYLLVPYLRARHPHLPLVDYNHLEQVDWHDGGYPAWSVRVGRQLDLNITCTRHLKEWMIGRGADAERIDVVYCCLDTERWRPEQYDSEATRRSLDIDADTPVILFVGRMVEQKRPLHVGKIIKALANQGERFIAVIVGDGPDLASLEAFLARHHLEARSHILGSQTSERVRELMAASDILLLPSEHEGLALVLYEAMATGLVPVAANVGGQAELVTPECGYLISHSDEDIAAYTAAVSSLLHQPEHRRMMSECSQARVRQSFDIRQMAHDMDQAFLRSQRLAMSRPGTDDLALGRFTAHVAVEMARLRELADKLWSEREQTPASQAPSPTSPDASNLISPDASNLISRDASNPTPSPSVSLLRRILPYNTRRYLVWKQVRRRVRGAIRKPARLARRASLRS